MELNVFLDNIELMYGKYSRNPGMKVAIENELIGCSEKNITALWDAIKNYHSKNYPPTWFEIGAIADRGRISIVNRSFNSLYVCGNCLTEFTLEEGRCPNSKCETRGFSLPSTCAWCFKKDIRTIFDDSQGVKTKCPVCDKIRTYAFIRRKI